MVNITIPHVSPVMNVTNLSAMRSISFFKEKVAVKYGVPPFAVFQDPSLDDMSLKYPITLDELSKVHGVGEGKSRKFGNEFISLISKYLLYLLLDFNFS